MFIFRPVSYQVVYLIEACRRFALKVATSGYEPWKAAYAPPRGVYGIWQACGLDSLPAVAFNGVRPSAQPTCGRGTKVKKDIKSHGHFCVFAKKAIGMVLK